MGVIDELNGRSEGALPGLIGLEITRAEEGCISSRLGLREELLAPKAIALFRCTQMILYPR